MAGRRAEKGACGWAGEQRNTTTQQQNARTRHSRPTHNIEKNNATTQLNTTPEINTALRPGVCCLWQALRRDHGLGDERSRAIGLGSRDARIVMITCIIGVRAALALDSKMGGLRPSACACVRASKSVRARRQPGHAIGRSTGLVEVWDVDGVVECVLVRELVAVVVAAYRCRRHCL